MREIVSTNPARGFEVIGKVAVTTAEETAAKVQCARKSQTSWQELRLTDRLAYVAEIQASFAEQIHAIAALQTSEMGKPIKESIEECNHANRFIGWHIENAPRILATRMLDRSRTSRTELHYEGYGVVAVIAPWNFPTHMFFNVLIPALAVGNAVVFKHSEECILTARLLQDVIDSTNLPPHIAQSIYGDGETGRELLSQEIDLAVFTGSSETGRSVYEVAASKCIPALLEMGGSSPAIVFDSTDLGSYARSIFAERFTNCGQVCCALKRLLVHENAVDSLVVTLKSLASAIRVGDPADENTEQGPLASRKQQELLEEQIADAIAKGATVVCGGVSPRELNGAYFSPTILTGVSKDMRIMNEEVFGPVLPVMTFTTEEEAIAIANDTEFGLSAFIFGEDRVQNDRVAKKLKAGQVSINGHSYFSDSAPFGGYKRSGIGRANGELGYNSLSQVKVLGREL